jgi:DNA-directed RNA polymerase specialized sigma24 family protein
MIERRHRRCPLLAARSDPEAFYRRHAVPVLGYLVRRTRDPELGADLTAETFASALGSARHGTDRARGRAALDAHVLDGQEYEAIARASGLSAATIRKRVLRALHTFCSSLGGES